MVYCPGISTFVLFRNASEIYTFLDLETESLTNYYRLVEKVISLINNREKFKVKLQAKANKSKDGNTLDTISKSDTDYFKDISISLLSKIKDLERDANVIVLWRGVNYGGLIDYENWFYIKNPNF